ncbi:LysR family transcriptional regulator [Burkholderia sp. SRS-W-2-2016]|uniref:LysR substrate-binding domain-containing protein n=1 Tax=Burkholderia sp. SRS-W-2-2016 TaxID=1926878 RepID=UPI00094AD876|nr:LysR substrate-binding domain-containing protein [Burkholderia sp. SRS-W-2-2016]OLL28305.1 LysR family transcriptional regulator [Burkholderia sp. SRS-W-2-2016]
MDMRQLKYFVQIVESGSLSKASRQLFIAQPALSQQMTRLEEEVGKPLLVRSSRGVKPTDNGEALYHHARFILRQLDQAVSVARRDHANVSGRVNLGMAPTTVCAIGLPLIKHLSAKYPGVILNVVEALSGHLEHMARLGELDLAVLFSTTAALDLTVEALLEEELFVIVPRDSTMIAAGRTDITLAELAKLPLILPSPGHGLRRRITLEFDRVNLTVDAVAEIDSLPLLMHCVADGIGATIKPMAAVHALQNAPEQWRCVRISDAQMVRRNYLYALAPENLSLAAAVVRDELKHVARTLIEEGRWQGVRLISPGDVPEPDDEPLHGTPEDPDFEDLPAHHAA